MAERIYKTKQAVLKRGLEAVGIPLHEIDTTNRLETGKGAVGSVLEEGWFGYHINSESEPDFAEAGVELKATPYVRTDKGVKAKERLVCNIINYMEEYDKTFATSSFWHKCNTMLIMSYEHRYDMPKGDYTIDKAVLFSFPDEDLAIIEHDWETIIQKVRDGRAHEISEGDTLYLGACTKGATAASVRPQPFSPVMAKQRAYSLKQSYMTSILRRFVFGVEENEHIIKDPSQLVGVSFIDFICARFAPYIGKSQEQLKQTFHVVSSAKSLNQLIVSKILDVTDIESSDEFKKANIMVKTIRIEADGEGIEQSMSFPAFDFKEVARQEWEDSDAYQQFVEQKYLFIVFRKDGEYNNDRRNSAHTERHLFLQSVFLWQLPEDDIEEVKQVWERAAETIRRGVTLQVTKRKQGLSYAGSSRNVQPPQEPYVLVENDLPKSHDSRIAHVRPHARRAAYRFNDICIGDINDADELPDGRWMTKQCFWFNNSYILDQLKKLIDGHS